jgi:hypothetical protein
MSDFQNLPISIPRVTKVKASDFETDMALKVNIGAAARLACVSHDDVHVAMITGTLPHHRDRDGRRVVTLGDLLAWMRTQPPA